jgi:hypothetical protein
MPLPIRCENCKFWERLTPEFEEIIPPPPPLLPSSVKDGIHGLCHRQPALPEPRLPTYERLSTAPIAQPAMIHPTTSHVDWCGEYIEAKNEEH